MGLHLRVLCPLQTVGNQVLHAFAGSCFCQPLCGGSCQLCLWCGRATPAAGHHATATPLCCRLQPAPKCNHPPCGCSPASTNCGQGHWLAVCHFLIMISPRSDPASAYALLSGQAVNRIVGCQRALHSSSSTNRPQVLLQSLTSCEAATVLAILAATWPCFLSAPRRIAEMYLEIQFHQGHPLPTILQATRCTLANHMLSLLDCLALARHPCPFLIGC